MTKRAWQGSAKNSGTHCRHGEKQGRCAERDAWCVPAAVVARFLEPLAAAAESKKSEAAGREGRAVLLSYARCLESEEGKARRAVAAGLAEIAPQIERLWPHGSAIRVWARNRAGTTAGDFAGDCGTAVRGCGKSGAGVAGKARIRRIRADTRNTRVLATG